jgi:hypothetical protein
MNGLQSRLSSNRANHQTVFARASEVYFFAIGGNKVALQHSSAATKLLLNHLQHRLMQLNALPSVRAFYKITSAFMQASVFPKLHLHRQNT